jgi:hypothetical protein
MTNGQNVSDVLTGRVRQAIAAAERAVARAEVVTVAARLVKTRDTMVRRCAWCGRLALDRWTAPELAPPFLALACLRPDDARHLLGLSASSRANGPDQAAHERDVSRDSARRASLPMY